MTKQQPQQHSSFDSMVAEVTETSADQFKGSLLVIPFDAPLPTALNALPIATGTLVQRLSALQDHPITSFEILPLTGEELIELARIWHLIADVKRISVLLGIPAARYDVLFDQGVRAAGLPTLHWSILGQALTRAVTEEQRAKDSKPWTSDTNPDADVKPVRRRNVDDLALGTPAPAEDEVIDK